MTGPASYRRRHRGRRSQQRTPCLRRGMRQGYFEPRDKVMFDDLASSRHDVREITRIGYVHVLKPARAQLGQARVQYLNRSDIETMIRTLRDRGLSHRTVVYTLGAIRQVPAYGSPPG